jgi:hypothetical protein
MGMQQQNLPGGTTGVFSPSSTGGGGGMDLNAFMPVLIGLAMNRLLGGQGGQGGQGGGGMDLNGLLQNLLGGGGGGGGLSGGGGMTAGSSGGLSDFLRNRASGIAQGMRGIAQQQGIQQQYNNSLNPSISTLQSVYADTGRPAPPGQHGEYDPNGPNAWMSSSANYGAVSGQAPRFINDPKLGQIRDPAQTAAANAYYAGLPVKNTPGFINNVPVYPGGPTTGSPFRNYEVGSAPAATPAARTGPRPAGWSDPNNPNYVGRAGNY